MPWRLLADATVVLHYAFLLYLVVGGYLAWRRPRTIVLHAAAAMWALLIVVAEVQCPLTWAQNLFRSQAGLPAVEGGFIATYVRGTIYPNGAELAVQLLVAAVVLASWIGLLVRRRRSASRRALTSTPLW